MDSIVSQNNIATEDIFAFHVLPYFSYEDIQCSSMINQTIEEYSYETRIHNIEEKIDNEDYLILHKNIEGIQIEKIMKLSEKIKFLALRNCKTDDIEKLFNNNRLNIPYIPQNKITHLELNYCQNVSDEHFEIFKNLTHLEIYSCPKITNEHFETFKNLTHLSLHYCQNITNEHFEIFKNLTHLTIYKYSKITNQHFETFKNLTHLSLHYCRNITNQHFETFKNLTSLEISYCDNITNEHFENFKNLTYLEIYDCPNFTDEYFETFKNLVNLTYLNINGRSH